MGEKKNPGIPLDCVSDGGAYNPEREKVRELRMWEMSCAEIAERLGIPEGTVILYCLKLGLRSSVPVPARTNFGTTGGERKRKSTAGRPCVRIAGRFSTQSMRGRSRSASAARTAILNSAMGEGSDGFLERLKVIGVFAVCNTGGICVHAIDHTEEKVLASMNGRDPEWYPITEQPLSEITGEEKDAKTMEPGFFFGSFFVPFSEVMRV